MPIEMCEIRIRLINWDILFAELCMWDMSYVNNVRVVCANFFIFTNSNRLEHFMNR